ncbi:hypothetical protein PLEOSDRAFT_1043366, partial [Pleurotus ostreatus PC15]
MRREDREKPPAQDAVEGPPGKISASSSDLDSSKPFKADLSSEHADSRASQLPELEDHWTYPEGVRPLDLSDEEGLTKSHLLVAFTPAARKEWETAYLEDAYFKDKFEAADVAHPDRVLTPSRFQKGSNGLLYFIDADWNYRLCVPQGRVSFVLKLIHEPPYESAHEGAR